MYIQFQCCQCGSRIRPDGIHSYSWNSSKEFYLCKHFPNVEFSYETKWGFFTLGWRITIYNIYAKCGNCKKWLHFDSKTFKKGTTHYNDYMECCDNVITLGAHEDDYYYSGSGFEVQNRINEKKKKLLEEIKKLLEEIERLEREEKLRKEREEKLRKKKKKKKKNRIRREQDEESEELDKVITFDTSRIQNDTKELINKAEINFTDNINYDVNEDIEKNFKYNVTKTS